VFLLSASLKGGPGAWKQRAAVVVVPSEMTSRKCAQQRPVSYARRHVRRTERIALRRAAQRWIALCSPRSLARNHRRKRRLSLGGQ
jgi:hypothetical protein